MMLFGSGLYTIRYLRPRQFFHPYLWGFIAVFGCYWACSLLRMYQLGLASSPSSIVQFTIRSVKLAIFNPIIVVLVGVYVNCYSLCSYFFSYYVSKICCHIIVLNCQSQFNSYFLRIVKRTAPVGTRSVAVTTYIVNFYPVCYAIVSHHSCYWTWMSISVCTYGITNPPVPSILK